MTYVFYFILFNKPLNGNYKNVIISCWLGLKRNRWRWMMSCLNFLRMWIMETEARWIFSHVTDSYIYSQFDAEIRLLDNISSQSLMIINFNKHSQVYMLILKWKNHSILNSIIEIYINFNLSMYKLHTINHYWLGYGLSKRTKNEKFQKRLLLKIHN